MSRGVGDSNADGMQQQKQPQECYRIPTTVPFVLFDDLRMPIFLVSVEFAVACCPRQIFEVKADGGRGGRGVARNPPPPPPPPSFIFILCVFVCVCVCVCVTLNR